MARLFDKNVAPTRYSCLQTPWDRPLTVCGVYFTALYVMPKAKIIWQSLNTLIVITIDITHFAGQPSLP